MRKLSVGLILVGLLIFLYPFLRDWNADRQQRDLLKEAAQIEAEAQQGSARDNVAVHYKELSRILDEGETADSTLEEQTGYEEGSPIGIITISKLELELPILEGATQSNMKNAAAHVTGTARLGEAGNAAIAAHRAHKTGRLFNRLNELTYGDEIIIKTDGRELIYRVGQISIVEPTDVSVLEGDADEQIITLITCDPLYEATHRLIVQAELVSD
ncbi:class D sortase [Paenibacillus sp. MDMC362]|uniref:class D sortase n=1 Tax=Paenibacillus sp. MDMC362 TaxID=2977365 RepID=UPI000DC2CF51|nr:class D sortase [Paenibacillus sp. MDMC362]RAR44396.1 class C sortase [Paenibacillus sp. MDMC362]